MSGSFIAGPPREADEGGKKGERGGFSCLAPGCSSFIKSVRNNFAFVAFPNETNDINEMNEIDVFAWIPIPEALSH